MLALRRVVYRALVVGLGELLLAVALLPWSPIGAKLLGYPLLALFLAVPAALVTLVELAAAHRAPGPRRTLAAGVGAWLVAIAGVVVAHFQALYAGAVVETRDLPHGLQQLRDGGTRLLGPDAATAAGMHFVALGVPFALAAVFSLDRTRPRMRLVAIAGFTILVALSQDEARATWGSRVFEEAAVLVSLSLPVFFALADRLAERGRQTDDEQNAR